MQVLRHRQATQPYAHCVSSWHTTDSNPRCYEVQGSHNLQRDIQLVQNFISFHLQSDHKWQRGGDIASQVPVCAMPEGKCTPVAASLSLKCTALFWLYMSLCHHCLYIMYTLWVVSPCIQLYGCCKEQLS